MERYCIKPAYQPNKRALTFEGNDKGSYWTLWRIREAGIYQYYVYQKCRSLLLKYRYKTLLDIGCGVPVKVKELLAPLCDEIVLIDQPSLAQMVKQLLPGGQFIGLDLEHVDLDLAKRFDLVICADVLEHLMNPDPCLRFIRQHLAPSGLAVLSTPERDSLRGKDCNYCPKPEHVREWNKAEFAQYISSRGFEIVEHLLMPKKRIKRVEFVCARLLSVFIRTRRWSSCQVVVCKLSGDDSAD